MKKNFKVGDVIFRKYVITSINDHEDYPIDIQTDNQTDNDIITDDGRNFIDDEHIEYFTEDEVFEMLKPKKELSIAQRLGIFNKFPFQIVNNNGYIVYDECVLGIWSERSYDEKGNQLTFKDSNGRSWERTYDEKGNSLTFKDSNGTSWEKTYDEKGNCLTFKHSNGTLHDYRPKVELTLDEIAEKLGWKYRYNDISGVVIFEHYDGMIIEARPNKIEK